MTGFAHDMPFGAAVLETGSVRFRLWAPAQSNVSVVIGADGTSLPMARAEEGWFELRTDRARAGDLYQFKLADGFHVPDPASRRQAGDVHGPSIVVDPRDYPWRLPDWQGRSWNEIVLYELHTGAFSEEGTFDGLLRKLDHLVSTGITALELMPIASCEGRRNWGYDGVLHFAPSLDYGAPDDLKALIDAAHERSLMVFLDVVYNHFGPSGNYLWKYAPQFFTERHKTLWGAAIDFSRSEVRRYFIDNALYWLKEYRFDGLRLDAVNAIMDESPTHILVELAETVRRQCEPGRHVHLVVENGANLASLLKRDAENRSLYYDAQWNDDFHHVCHRLMTGETTGYYVDYADKPLQLMGRSLAEGFVYQGEVSIYWHDAPRGEPCAWLPPTAFVDFLQNHDHIGNRALGERLTVLTSPQALKAMTAIFLLAPQIPLLFMGEEWGETNPFYFFCDFGGELATAVREGRRQEFARFAAFSDPAIRDRIPDPNALSSFLESKLDWNKADQAPHRDRLELYRTLLALRHREISPRLAGHKGGHASYDLPSDEILRVRWQLPAGERLTLMAQLSDQPAQGVPLDPAGKLLYSTHPEIAVQDLETSVPAWFAAWYLTDAEAGP
jgi:maltooligosyltrehalose trehalohydrolase